MKTVAVLGLGYVGFPLVELLVKSGKYSVIGLDISKEKVEQARRNLKSPRFSATGDFAKIKEADISVVCVPTPVYENFKPDYGPVRSACESIAQNLKPGQLVIIESTINPGTCEEVVMPVFEKFGLIGGKDFLLAHCPERIDPGNKKWTLENIPRNAGGLDEKSAMQAAKFYRSFLRAEVKILSCLKATEATKIIENTFRDINIAYVNELAMSFDTLGIDLPEVIDGAKTKPFAFMPHYPGVGVGGHCFEKNQMVFFKTADGIETLTFEELYARVKDAEKSGGEFEILSFDPQKKRSCFKKVLMATQRPAESVLRLRTQYGYELKVTDLHPVFICRGSKLQTCFAKDIKMGDYLVINRFMPVCKKRISLDAIGNISTYPWSNSVRVSPQRHSWTNWQKQLEPLLENDPRAKDNYYRYNFLPLPTYVAAEERKLIPAARNSLVLKTGRGPACKTIPAIIEMDKDFCRLIGYYLSEGCLTKDKSARVRFCFNSNEYEYLTDVKNILRKHGVSFSEYHSKQWRASYIKVSSNIFGAIIERALGCGTNCYNMAVPSQLFALPRSHRREIVKGLLRGDGGVDITEGKRLYKKRGKLYLHENNSTQINYFSSSKKLFQQAFSLLLDQSIFPRARQREGLVGITAAEDIAKLRDFFDGRKKILLNRAAANQRKVISRDKSLRHTSFLTVPVTSVESLPTDVVYSVEVADTHAIVTSYGIVVHNCIPVDPYYLIERAQSSGFTHKFLKRARAVNNGMPAYTVGLLEKELGKIGKKLYGAKVGLLGLAYKKDIGDLRESPALRVLKILKRKGAKVTAFDPYIPEMSGAASAQELMKKCGAIILATAHAEFLKITPREMKNAGVKIIIDGRNCLPKEEILAAGIAYKGIGH